MDQPRPRRVGAKFNAKSSGRDSLSVLLWQGLRLPVDGFLSTIPPVVIRRARLRARSRNGRHLRRDRTIRRMSVPLCQPLPESSWYTAAPSDAPILQLRTGAGRSTKSGATSAGSAVQHNAYRRAAVPLLNEVVALGLRTHHLDRLCPSRALARQSARQRYSFRSRLTFGRVSAHARKPL